MLLDILLENFSGFGLLERGARRPFYCRFSHYGLLMTALDESTSYCCCILFMDSELSSWKVSGMAPELAATKASLLSKGTISSLLVRARSLLMSILRSYYSLVGMRKSELNMSLSPPAITRTGDVTSYLFEFFVTPSHFFSSVMISIVSLTISTGYTPLAMIELV